jgi:hypothetical protein
MWILELADIVWRKAAFARAANRFSQRERNKREIGIEKTGGPLPCFHIPL